MLAIQDSRDLTISLVTPNHLHLYKGLVQLSEIYSRDYKGLPKKHWKYHTFCWYIHDIILSIFHDCMENDKINTIINFKNETHAKKFEKSNDLFNWLYKNGYGGEADLILGKKIFHAILADMMNFIYESLNTIEKGKITVSLALLRKPIRDNLLYLEWLLGNSEEITRLVYNADIDKYAIESVNNQQKLTIIKNALNEIDNKEFFEIIDGNVYFDLRYNKDSGNSLQKVWDKANHLVTTRKHNRSNEFNFVFLDEKIHLDFIDYYYKQVPHLLFYTYNIVIKLYEKYFRNIAETTKIYNNSLIIYKFCDMNGTVNTKEYFNKETRVLLNFPCLVCKKVIQIRINSKQFKEFRYGWSFECRECKNEINTSKYVFWEDYGE